MKHILKFKKALILILALFVLGSLASCSKDDSSPKKTVQNFFDAIKKNDLEKATKYVSYDGEEVFNYENEEQEKIGEKIVSKIKYEIVLVSTLKKENKSTAIVKITAPDMSALFTKILQEQIQNILSSAFSGSSDSSGTSVEEELLNALSGSDVPTVTTEVTINLVKDEEGKNWLIKLDEDLMNALTGNLLNIANELQQLSGF